jgi:nucleoside phosphorylase
MKVRDITDKIKDIVIPRDVKKEDFELTESEKKEITEDNTMTEDQKAISDETEVDIANNKVNNDDEEIKIRTIIVTEEDNEKENKTMMSTAIKLVVGASIAAAGLAAIFLNSRKRK